MQIVKLVLTLPLLLTSRSFGQYTNPEICISKCLCLDNDGVVSCHKDDKIKALPTNIRSRYTRLILQQGQFDSPVLEKQNMTNLEHLTLLKIVYYNLKYISPNTFSNMVYLQYLDLSNNQFHKISPYTFNGLSLIELVLVENPNMEFYSLSFAGLKCQKFNLRSNKLSSLEFEMLQHTNVKYLYLYNNSIAKLDPRFRLLFTELDSIIDLSDNPLNCDCSLAWLKQKISVSSKKKHINVTCAQPLHLRQRNLMNLTMPELDCDPLRIQEVHLSFNSNNNAEISCVSSVGGHDYPKISWLQQDINSSSSSSIISNSIISSSSISRSTSNQMTIFSNIKNQKKALESPKFTVINKINLTLNRKTRKTLKLMCIASVDDGRMEKLKIYLNNINKLFIKPYNHTNNAISVNNNVDLEHQLEFLFRKQFSLLELLAASFSTFLLTVFMIFLLIKYIQMQRKKTLQNSRDAKKEVNSVGPFILPLYDHSSTYSVPQDLTYFPTMPPIRRLSYWLTNDSISNGDNMFL